MPSQRHPTSTAHTARTAPPQGGTGFLTRVKLTDDGFDYSLDFENRCSGRLAAMLLQSAVRRTIQLDRHTRCGGLRPELQQEHQDFAQCVPKASDWISGRRSHIPPTTGSKLNGWGSLIPISDKRLSKTEIKIAEQMGLEAYHREGIDGGYYHGIRKQSFGPKVRC